MKKRSPKKKRKPSMLAIAAALDAPRDEPVETDEERHAINDALAAHAELRRLDAAPGPKDIDALSGARYVGTRNWQPSDLLRGILFYVVSVAHKAGEWEAIYCRTEAQAQAIAALGAGAGAVPNVVSLRVAEGEWFVVTRHNGESVVCQTEPQPIVMEQGAVPKEPIDTEHVSEIRAVNSRCDICGERFEHPNHTDRLGDVGDAAPASDR